MNYYRVPVYPAITYILMGSGLGMVFIAFVINKFSTYKENPKSGKRDNREIINKWINGNLRFANWLLGIAILTLIVAALYDWSWFFRLLEIYFLIGVGFIGFLFVASGDRVDEHDDLDFNGKTKKFLDLIDYRRHPFNISLILYVLVVGSFVMSKQLDIPFYMEVSGNPRYAISLPDITYFMSGLMIISTYIYIINNGDIFGVRKAEQNGTKVLQIHIAEIIICGATLLMWIYIVIEALIL